VAGTGRLAQIAINSVLWAHRTRHPPWPQQAWEGALILGGKDRPDLFSTRADEIPAPCDYVSALNSGDVIHDPAHVGTESSGRRRGQPPVTVVPVLSCRASATIRR